LALSPTGSLSDVASRLRIAVAEVVVWDQLPIEDRR
jgi:hypothetical protein